MNLQELLTLSNLQQGVLTAAPLVFTGCLIPVYRNAKAGFPKHTSILTAYTLFVLAITYSTMNYVYPAITSGVLGLEWLWISKHRVSHL